MRPQLPVIIFSSPSLIVAMLALALLALPLLSTAAVHGRGDDHSHSAANGLPSTWFHDPDHPGTAHCFCPLVKFSETVM
jgi:hypothetical protein